jgi:threonine-phosphate decarboxylase
MINSSAKLAHGGNVWAAAQKWGKAPQEFLDYSANINPLGPCPASLTAIEESLGLPGTDGGNLEKQPR